MGSWYCGSDWGADLSLGLETTGGISRDAAPKPNAENESDYAAEGSKISVFGLLLESGAKMEYSTPLCYAADNGTGDADGIHMMALLLDIRVDVNRFDGMRGHFGKMHHFTVLL